MIRVFYHEPTDEAHENGPVHFQDSEDGVHIVPVTICGVPIKPEWHRHTMDGYSSMPPYFDVICRRCLGHDLLRHFTNDLERIIMVETMLILEVVRAH
jgi:hypothetical protein